MGLCCLKLKHSIQPLPLQPLPNHQLSPLQEEIEKYCCQLQESLQSSLDVQLINKMNWHYSDYVKQLVERHQLPNDVRLYYYFSKPQLEIYLRTQLFSDQIHYLKIQEILKLYNQIERAIKNCDFLNFPALNSNNLEDQYLSLKHLESLIQHSSFDIAQMIEFKKSLKNIYFKINQKKHEEFVFNQLDQDQLNIIIP